MGRTIKISELERFDVFVFNGVNWIWPDITNNGIFECRSVNRGGVLYIGPDSDEYNQEVELLGRMEFIKTEDEIHGDNYFGSASQR